MKRLLILFMTITLFLASSAAIHVLAEESQEGDLFCCVDCAAEEPQITTDATRKIPHFATQKVYAPVTIVREQADGSAVAITIYPCVAEITYKYFVVQSLETGGYTGGSIVLCDTYPKVEAVKVEAVDEEAMAVSVARETFPVKGRVEGLPNQYTVQISGGLMTITYPAAIRYDMRGKIVSATPATISRAYNYTVTGP